MIEFDTLMKKCLDLAIKGKLVQQDPNDEPASELLKKIKAEKEQLIKDKKIKKDKNESTIFRGKDGLFYETIGNETKCIQEEIPFEIPDSWEWCRLRSISQSNIGLTYKPSEISKDGVPVLRSSNIQNNALDLENDLKRIVKSNIPEKCFVKEGDILICARNGSKDLVGKNAIIPKIHEKCAFGAFMAVVRSSYTYYIKIFVTIQNPL